MALKDWKRLGDDGWINKEEDVITVSKDAKGKYQVIIVKRDGSIAKESRTGIKTKGLALKSARSYMRSH